MDSLDDLRAAIEALSETVEAVAEGRDLDAQSIREIRASIDTMRHTVDDPANPRNLRDETTRAHTRLDGHDTRFAEGGQPRSSGEPEGWRAALARAVAVPLDALGRLRSSTVWALVVGVVLVALIVSGELVPLVRALRGAPETTIEAPGSQIEAPASTIRR